MVNICNNRSKWMDNDADFLDQDERLRQIWVVITIIATIMTMDIIMINGMQFLPLNCYAVDSFRPRDTYMRRQHSHHGSDNGLWPRRQGIIWTYTGILSTGRFGTNFNNRNSNIFNQGNAFESCVCKMEPIMSLPQCVNTQPIFCTHKMLVVVAFAINIIQHTTCKF